jgi:hypothetical protein
MNRNFSVLLNKRGPDVIKTSITLSSSFSLTNKEITHEQKKKHDKTTAYLLRSKRF